ncbi:heme ABC transporter ATP-binding protein [Dongia sp.]|uniref:heme ABC transporter ATP-binding protein n=1 Tax=Dongia sp. TaxID=1977262 RepID=UPI0035B393FE
MLTAENIVRRAGGLNGISLDVKAACVTTVIGANGAGKSTLLDVLSGRKSADSGSVVFAGRPIDAWRPQELARKRGYLPQASDVAFDIKVDDLVALGRAPYGEYVADGAIEAALRLTQANHLRGRFYHRLSGGERQRVQLARVIAQVWRPGPSLDERLLFLDEPTASLDPGHRLSVMRVLRELAGSGIGVLLALHDLNDAVRFADHVLLLHRGRLLADGPPADVLKPRLLEEAYAAEVDMTTASDGAPVILFR